MKKHHITISFNTNDEATRFRWLILQLSAGFCGLRAIACSLRKRLHRADVGPPIGPYQSTNPEDTTSSI